MVESSECVCVCEWANLPNWKLTDIAIEDLIYVTNKKPYVQVWPQSGSLAVLLRIKQDFFFYL